MPILRPLVLALLIVHGLQFPPPAVDVPKRAAPEWLAPYRDAAGHLLGEAVATDAAWQRLAYLGDTYGNRLSGSPNLEAAIKWAVEEMKRDGLENVHAEAVKVPHWVRGRESLEIAGPIPQPLVMLGLGNSVGTPPAGIEADLLVVHSFEELDAARDRVKGRIVLFNVPVHHLRRHRAVSRRRAVARRDARRRRRAGAFGRTGRPAHAAYRGAELHGGTAADSRGCGDHGRRRAARSAWSDRGTKVRLKLMMEAKFLLPEADSANVVGEIRGRELPTKWWSSAGTSIPGTSAPDRPTTGAAAWRRGKRCG